MLAVLAVSTWSSVAVPVTTGAPVGASLTPLTVTVALWLPLPPPSPSVSTKRTVRAPVVGAPVSVSWKVMLRTSACAAAGDDRPLKVMTRLAPALPPAKLPIVTPL